jgi:hypothetical protein
MKLYNETSTNDYYASTEFYFYVYPGILIDEGNQLTKEIFSTYSLTTYFDTLTIYFQTSKNISLKSYIEIDLPDEIKIGNNFTGAN